MTAPPHLALPSSRPRRAPSALLALAAHALVIAAVVWHEGRSHQGGAGGSRLGASGGGDEGRRAVNFFALAAAPGAAPASVSIPAPDITLAQLPALPAIPLDLASLTPIESAPIGAGAVGTGKGEQGMGAGTGGGAGAGAGGGGPGTGGEGDYIFVASPRTAIMPPAKAPGSVAGRTYRVRFWVAADGRVTRVEVDPPIHDEGYRREFLDRMMAYRFYPTRTRDGATVADTVTVSLHIGN